MVTMLEPGSNDIEAHDRAYDEADYLVESLNAAEYSVSVSEKSVASNETMYTTEMEGSAMELLAEATVANARINGGKVMNTNFVVRHPENEDVPTIREKIRNFLLESQTTAHIHSVWSPGDNDAVRGEIEIGPEPPADEEVSTATLTYPAGYRGADTVRTDPYAATEMKDRKSTVAAHIVEAFVPPGAMQYNLEQDAKALELAEHRYKRMAYLLSRYGGARMGDVMALDKEFKVDEGWTEYPDVGVLNNIIITMLKDNITIDSGVDREADPMTVEITVHTW
jgi:hypothetical protein